MFTEEKKQELLKMGLSIEQIKIMEAAEENKTTNKLTKNFINSLYLPKYKPTVYASKIKDNFTVNISSFTFEAVDTDKSIKNIQKITGNVPEIPTKEELQKTNQTAFNLVVNGSIITESDTEPQEVQRFVISLNNLKALTGFNSIENTYDKETDTYNVKSITVDNKLKRVLFSKIEM